MISRGMILISGLMLLAAISLLALAGTSGMILQKHMAANFGQSHKALQNAESAQASGLAWLFSRPGYQRELGCVIDCVLPMAIQPPGTLPERPETQSQSWWLDNGFVSGTHPETGEKIIATQAGNDGDAQWIVEELHFKPNAPELTQPKTEGVGYYRILGRGSIDEGRSVAVTEVIVARPWGNDVVPTNFPLDTSAFPFCSQFDDRSRAAIHCGILTWQQRRW